MKVLASIRTYSSEPINRLLALLIVVLTSLTLFNFSFTYFSYNYFEKPLRMSIGNQVSKGKLANIINRELLLLDNDFLSFAYSENERYVKKLHVKIKKRVRALTEYLAVLQAGGPVTDRIEINTSQKDIYVDTFEYRKTSGSTLRPETLELPAKLAGIIDYTKKIIGLKSANINNVPGDYHDTAFDLSYNIKKASALIQRSKEIVNNIYSNIFLETSQLESDVKEVTGRLNLISLFVDILLGGFALIFVVLILRKINIILETKLIVEEKNTKTNESFRAIINNIPVGVVLIDHTKEIVQLNEEASKILGYGNHEMAQQCMIGTKCGDSFCKPPNGKCAILDLGEPYVTFSEAKMISRPNIDKKATLLKSVIPVTIDDQDLLMEVFIDISERVEAEEQLRNETIRTNDMARKAMHAEEKLKEYSENLEDMVQERTKSLEKTMSDLQNTQVKLVQSEKLASMGQLASGIAHEINTPIQFVGDNLQFLSDSFEDFHKLVESFDELMRHPSVAGNDDIVSKYNGAREDADIDFLAEEIPLCFNQTFDGVERVASIVRSMKDFSHPGGKEKEKTCINSALSNTMTVSRNEWKYYANIETDFDENLPEVSCFPAELNQVFLNLITNAAHAIQNTETFKQGNKGIINIVTRQKKDKVVISIHDTGCGIPEDVHSKIFDPFYTTKEVGKGTGQGLSISHSVIVEQHGGGISFETYESGTVFHVQLPVDA